MRVINKFGICVFLTCLSINTLNVNSLAVADDISDTVTDTTINADEGNYYEKDGNLVFKIRASGIKTNGKQKKASSSTVRKPGKVGSLAEVGYGFDASTSIFFSPNIALELSVGLNVLRTKGAHLAQVASNNRGDVNAGGKKKAIYTIPVTVLGQYHIAPFGAIRPYIGAGYHGAYTLTRSKAFDLKGGFGPVLQAGIDFYAKDDTLINFDVRQYFLKTKIDYKKALVNNLPVSSTIKLNPLLISIGVGFKF